MTKLIDLTDKKFYRLLVLERAFTKGRVKWVCKCDCGNIVNILAYHLISGHTKSCGCYNVDINRQNKLKHGMRKDRFYKIWCCMKERCLNKNNPAYSEYGGRGIDVEDKRWLVFENFKEDMYESYLTHLNIFGKTNTTIERTDNNRGYCKDNCSWATRKEQRLNQRKRRM